MDLEAVFPQNQEENSNCSDALSVHQFDSPILQESKLFLLKFSSKNTRDSYERGFLAFIEYWKM